MAKLPTWLNNLAGPLAAGAGGALAVLIVHDLALGTGKPLFEWSETNQGFLSVLALGVALVFALIENHRANSASADRRAEYVATALAIMDEAEAANRSLRDGINSAMGKGESPSAYIGDWNYGRGRMRETIDIIRPSAPPDGLLALAMAELIDAMFYHMQLTNISEVALKELAEIENRMAVVRKKIADRG